MCRDELLKKMEVKQLKSQATTNCLVFVTAGNGIDFRIHHHGFTHILQH